MTEDEADDYEAWKTARSLDVVRARKRYHEEELTLQNAVGDLAKKLGLKVRVSYDSMSFGYCIDAGFIQTGACRATCTLDEELFLMTDRRHFADLILREMLNLQYRVFDATASRMAELDDRGRCYGVLSRDDKVTLHEMYCEVEKTLYAAFTYGNEAGFKAQEEKRLRFAALIGKLFK